MHPKQTQGFTLIEVLMVIVIIGILASFGNSTYSRSVMKSQRQAAKIELMDIIKRQEQYFINAKAYATKLSDLGFTADMYEIDSNNSVAAANGIYQMSLANADGSKYTAVATPKSRQLKDECGTLQLTSTGEKKIVGGTADVSTCW